jgi:hypothetical protein
VLVAFKGTDHWTLQGTSVVVESNFLIPAWLLSLVARMHRDLQTGVTSYGPTDMSRGGAVPRVGSTAAGTVDKYKWVGMGRQNFVITVIAVAIR